MIFIHILSWQGVNSGVPVAYPENLSRLSRIILDHTAPIYLIFSVPILHLFCQENLAVSSCAQPHRSHRDPSADRLEIGCKVCFTEGTFRDISEGFQTCKQDQSLPCPSHLPSWIAFMLTLRGNTSCNHRNPLCVCIYIYIFGMIYVAWVDGKSRFRVPWGTPLVPQNYQASYGRCEVFGFQQLS